MWVLFGLEYVSWWLTLYWLMWLQWWILRLMLFEMVRVGVCRLAVVQFGPGSGTFWLNPNLKYQVQSQTPI